jgi:hypothetical protein
MVEILRFFATVSWKLQPSQAKQVLIKLAGKHPNIGSQFFGDELLKNFRQRVRARSF